MAATPSRPFDESPSGQLVAGAGSPRRVRGHAWDVGAQWRFPGEARPTPQPGAWASGSGRRRHPTRRIENFRQTGLQENKGRMSGVKRWRFYGEVLDPELSNLRVASAGFGLRLYRQQLRRDGVSPLPAAGGFHPAGGLAAVGEPAGRATETSGASSTCFSPCASGATLELTVKLGRFQPGSAFAEDRRDPAPQRGSGGHAELLISRLGIRPRSARSVGHEHLHADALKGHAMTTVAVIGLGYVGLPLVVEFGKRIRTIGFDIDASRVHQCQGRHGPFARDP